MTGEPDVPASRGAVGVVLAAGPGTRFGGVKQLAVLAGRPLLAHAVEPLAAATLPVVVVVGAPHGPTVRTARRDWDGAAPSARVVDVSAESHGIGWSLAAAAAFAGPRDLVVVLGDQPGIEPGWVRAVVDALDAGAPAARVVHPDGPGHPVGFSAQLHGALTGLGPDAGADLFATMGGVEIAVPTPRPPDVDTPADLRALGP